MPERLLGVALARRIAGPDQEMGAVTVAAENRARRRLDRDAADIAGADLLEEDVDEGTGRRPELLRPCSAGPGSG